MIAEAFLICALALPSPSFTWPRIVPWFASNEEEKLTDWLRKHNEIDEVFIHENPQEDKLKDHGWERVPFTINGKKIWIKRKPHADQKMMEVSA